MKNNKKCPTAHNRIVYAHRLFGSSGSEKLQSGYALCAILSPPKIFVLVKCFAFSFIGHKNPSYTTGTLGEIKSGNNWNI
jgi:hypothetical protein